MQSKTCACTVVEIPKTPSTDYFPQGLLLWEEKFANTKYLNFPPDNQFFGDWRTKTNILDLHFLMRLLLGDTYYIKCILLNTSGSIMFYLSGKSEITSQIRVNTLHRIVVQYWSLHLRNGGVNFYKLFLKTYLCYHYMEKSCSILTIFNIWTIPSTSKTETSWWVSAQEVE